MAYIKHTHKYKLLFLNTFLASTFFYLSACDKPPATVENKKTVSITTEVITPVPEHQPHPSNVIIENKSYLFDVTNHSMDEFHALLTRVEEVSQTEDFTDLEIIMVIHGPDIEWFTQQNYAENRSLIDLAAKLDAYDVIDLKVCEKTMSRRDVDRKDLPSFIESVPFAPTEIENRLRDGYINL